MAKRINPLKHRIVSRQTSAHTIVGQPAQTGEPATTVETESALRGATTVDTTRQVGTFCASSGHVMIKPEQIGGICNSCGRVLCMQCAANPCAICGACCCETKPCSTKVSGKKLCCLHAFFERLRFAFQH